MRDIVKILDKIRVGLMKYVLMVGFSGILGTGSVEDQKIIIAKLIDGRK